MTTNIQYAHCTKFTKGKLDVAPYSAYEMRYAEVEVYMEEDPECDCCDWYVSQNGKIIGTGDTREDAIHSAEYALMDQSRDSAKNLAQDTV